VNKSALRIVCARIENADPQDKNFKNSLLSVPCCKKSPFNWSMSGNWIRIFTWNIMYKRQINLRDQYLTFSFFRVPLCSYCFVLLPLKRSFCYWENNNRNPPVTGKPQPQNYVYILVDFFLHPLRGSHWKKRRTMTWGEEKIWEVFQDLWISRNSRRNRKYTVYTYTYSWYGC